MSDGRSIHGSVTLLLGRLRLGETDVTQDIFDIYFDRLAALGQTLLSHRHRKMSDGEDLAIEVLSKLFADAPTDHFPELKSRHDFWRMITDRLRKRAATQVTRENRLKRGGGQVSGESVFRTHDGCWDPTGIANVADTTANAISLLNDELIGRFQDPILRNIVELLLQGFTAEEISSSIQKSRSTVYRKLEMIRDILRNDGGDSSAPLPV
jgi:DNA-directed RNA polymerase specialized sigma24 family protein